MTIVNISSVKIGRDQPLAIIAGPCVAESYDLCVTVGEAMRDRCAALGFGYIFKASYDKANRSSIASFRGAGIDEGLTLLHKIGDALGVPVTTDIHESHHAAPAAQVVDLLQIPAFLCRQTDLLVAAARTGKPINVKKGQFLSPAEMSNVIRKLTEAGQSVGREEQTSDDSRPTTPIILTERGTFFGYHRLVNDFVGLGDLMDYGYPICFDVTHSTQQPGNAPGSDGTSTGGRPDRAPLLARAAVAVGVDALFIETHPQPHRARSDAASMLPLDRTLALLDELARLRETVTQRVT